MPLEGNRDAPEVGKLGEPAGQDRREAVGDQAGEVERDMRRAVGQPVFRDAPHREPLVSGPAVEVEHADDRPVQALEIDRYPVRAHAQPEQPVFQRDRGAVDGDAVELLQQALAGPALPAGFEQGEGLAALAGQADAQIAVLPSHHRNLGVAQADRLEHQPAVQKRGQRQPDGEFGNPGDHDIVPAAQLGVRHHQIERPTGAAPGQHEVGKGDAVGKVERGQPLLHMGFEKAEGYRAFRQFPRAVEGQADQREGADQGDVEADAEQAAHHGRPEPA